MGAKRFDFLADFVAPLLVSLAVIAVLTEIGVAIFAATHGGLPALWEALIW